MVEIEAGPAERATASGGAEETEVAGGRTFTSRVVGTEPVMGDSTLLTMTLPPGMAASIRPGQFVEVRCRVGESYDPFLRRPYSVYATDPRAETMTLMVRPFGRGSTWLARREAGEELDVLGPLGNGFDVAPRSTNLLMVAGGVGVAPLVFLANQAVGRGLNVTFLMGAASSEGLLPATMLPAAVEYLVATDDGSQGHHGFVTDLVPEYLRWADQVFSCGPDPMFRSLRAVVERERVGTKPTVQVSVERPMACGLGACLGCVVETRTGMQTSCVQGPVFDMADIVW